MNLSLDLMSISLLVSKEQEERSKKEEDYCVRLAYRDVGRHF
jgi:hypothetical protein